MVANSPDAARLVHSEIRASSHDSPFPSYLKRGKYRNKLGVNKLIL